MQNGWTALHFATKAGTMPVIKLLLESGADPLAETKEGKVALCFAAAANHYPALSFLMENEHDTYQLMDDKKVSHFRDFFWFVFLILIILSSFTT